VPRARSLSRDSAALAAGDLRDGRVQTVDLTRFFCDATSCFPVIGGALVYKDISHLTTVYATTLEPYLRRALDALPALAPAQAASVQRASTAPSRATARDGARPRCFGAASRDTRRPCRNPRLRLSVVPTPTQARGGRNAPCEVIATHGLVRVCAFGTTARKPAATIALVGDSHASHWRAALAHVARVRRWRGLSMTHSSCPLSLATRRLDPPDRAACARWRRELLAWFRRHPEVRTVFVGALSGGKSVVAEDGRTRFETSVSGYLRAWRALPRSVKRIVVIRDTPKVRPRTGDCVEAAMRARRAAGPACATSRGEAVDRDAAAVAAQRLRSRRVRTVSLLGYFCGRATCPPVIGGALVYKDTSHLTSVFATTLGPYLRRAVAAIGA
jgi:hypothetical protein